MRAAPWRRPADSRRAMSLSAGGPRSRAMVDDRLNRVARRLLAVGDEYERALAEEQRRADEAAELKLRVERGWRILKPKREEVLAEVNAALSESRFQLNMSNDFGVLTYDEIDYFLVTIQGRHHPKLSTLRLRVALKENGVIVADVITEATSRRLKRVTYEDFTPAAWREMLLDYLELAGSDDPERVPLAGAK